MSEKTTNCVVRDVKLKNNNLGPIIVSFEHSQVNGDNVGNLRCGVFSEDGKHVVAAIADGGDIVYQGHIDEDKSNLCRSYIAVKRKDSQKVTLYEANSVLLSPHFKDFVAESSELYGLKDAAVALSQAFGSKKSKRISDQRGRMALNVDAVKHKVPSLINDIKVDSGTLESGQDTSLEKLLPLCNRSALTISHAYPIEGILNADELKSLENVALEITEGKIPPPKLSPFCEQLATLIKSDHQRNLALLLYVQSLVDFCSGKREESIKRKDVCPHSEKAWNRIVQDFMSSTSSKFRSAAMEDKAVAYIIILNFHIGNNICDVNLLAKSVKRLNVSRIKFIARIVGAKPSESKDQVILAFPLRTVSVTTNRSRSRR